MTGGFLVLSCSDLAGVEIFKKKITQKEWIILLEALVLRQKIILNWVYLINRRTLVLSHHDFMEVSIFLFGI